MGRKSTGRMRRKSRFLGRKTRKADVTVTQLVRKIETGSKVQLVPNVKFEDFPFPRYTGRVGTVVGRQGNAYVVELKDGGLTKKFITSSVHLKSL